MNLNKYLIIAIIFYVNMGMYAIQKKKKIGNEKNEENNKVVIKKCKKTFFFPFTT